MAWEKVLVYGEVEVVIQWLWLNGIYLCSSQTFLSSVKLLCSFKIEMTSRIFPLCLKYSSPSLSYRLSLANFLSWRRSPLTRITQGFPSPYIVLFFFITVYLSQIISLFFCSVLSPSLEIKLPEVMVFVFFLGMFPIFCNQPSLSK